MFKKVFNYLMATAENVLITITVYETEINLRNKSWGPVTAGHSLTAIS